MSTRNIFKSNFRTHPPLFVLLGERPTLSVPRLFGSHHIMATLQVVRRGTGEVRHSGNGGFVRYVVIFVFLFLNIYPSDLLLLKRTKRGKQSCPYVTAYHYSIFILQLFILAPVRVFCVQLNACYLALNNVPPNNF